MKLKLILSALLFFQLLFLIGVAQNGVLQFNPVKDNNGKPLGKILNMVQDKNGYMWLASETNQCIYRYDGSRMTAYKHDDADTNSLGGTSVNSVYADDAGMIWIGLGETGLDEYNPATGIFKHFSHVSNNSGSLATDGWTIMKDRKGRVWVGGHQGLDCLDEQTGKFIHYRNEPGNKKSLSSNFVWCIYEDRQGAIWIGTGNPWFDKNPEEGGLNRLETDGSFTRYMHNPIDLTSLISNKVAAIYEDKRGSFWVGTSGDGLHTMDRTTGRFQRHLYNPKEPGNLSRPPLRPKEVNDKITFISEDSMGIIWIGTMYSGINRYNTETEKIIHYQGSNGFADSTSWNAFTSRDGEVWVTTENANLLRTDPFYKPVYNIATSDQATRFLQDKEGLLWVGTMGGGLLKFDTNEKLINQFKHDSTNAFSLFDKGNNVLTLFQNQPNILWLGTGNGVGYFNNLTRQFFKLPIDLKFNPQQPWKPVSNIIEDKQGLKWFATGAAGLVRFNGKDSTAKQYLPDAKDSESISSDIVITVLEDLEGTIWCGGQSGINRLDKKTGHFTHYLKSSFVVKLFQDKSGTIWAGTRNGLYRYHKTSDRFSSFFDQNAYASTSGVEGIIEDAAKDLWLLSPSAIIKLNPVTKETFIYGSRFGIMPNSLQKSAIYINSKGHLFVGYDKGYYSFYPQDIAMGIYPLKIIVTEIFVNSVAILPGQKKSLLNQADKSNELLLNHEQNNLTLSFAAIDYREPESIQYFTMLENYDNEWRQALGEKSSHYFNVPPGKYVYHIKAINSDGTKAEKSITIIIDPPWWKTWWAYCVYGLLLLSLIYAVYRYQKQRIIHLERQKRQQFELAQAKEIEKAYTELKATQAQLIQSEKMASLGELTAGIAHEIQNPLNFVNNFSEVNKELLAEMKDELMKGNIDEANAIANDVIDNEQKINHHGKRADAIVKGMLQHSRSSSGVKELTDINALADEYLRLSYHGLRAKDKSFNATIKTDFDQSIGKINIIPQDIGRVILNLINNAFYVVNEKKQMNVNVYEPTVSVSTKKMGDKIYISVEDNGNGIPKKSVDKIFQPFFTTKPTGQGTGLGLSLSYDIIKAHGGEIKVETKEGEGTSFIIQLPIV